MRIPLLVIGILGGIVLLMLGMSGLIDSDSLVQVSVGNTKIRVAVADTKEEQTRGLSFRPSLPEDEGMLFVFQEEGYPRFWMKDMHFPIDILWVDKNRRVVEITEHISQDSYPERFSPSVPVLYVLEVNAGWAKENGVQVGDEVKFEN